MQISWSPHDQSSSDSQIQIIFKLIRKNLISGAEGRLSLPIQSNYLRANNNNYHNDGSRATTRQQRSAPRVVEQLPPSYNSIGHARRQFPLLTPITHPRIDRSTTNITPSVYNAMPPSYAELFLTSENKR
ncbi:unnamed protein product [Didymodactylos carnosus]|uniref:Uncharacterized protein n=1 Tax=Didymodactylos carnosus TaxID=1234261 RepID=A0A8S2FZ63_9BILA|nr:unnamed protein product [Didymodactylos carnosus]CAF4399519.1 unnamed protein product [Didymodactylos carnosus]